MSHRQIAELELRSAQWWDSLRNDAARLRYYQRNLKEMRRFSPRPHHSVALTLRQCAAARKMRDHAARVVGQIRRDIHALTGCSAQ